MKFYTTPIFYTNAKPHIGHAYTTLIADFYGNFQTGTDEHGLKILKAALKNNKKPKEFVDENFIHFESMWKEILNSNPSYITRTTNDTHKKIVEKYWNKCLENGDIYKGEYEGLYCVGCEAFITSKDLIDEKCIFHGTKPEYTKEETYFFNLKKYQKRLVELYKNNEDLITPKTKLNEVLSLLAGEIQPLSVSRKGLEWGIKVPNDTSHTIYVWFDALFNYLDNIKPENLKNTTHILGKDILKFHAIYWPAFLFSAGFSEKDIPKLLVHGFVTNKGNKIAKSLKETTKLSLEELHKLVGTDAIRFFLLKNFSLENDIEFNLETLIEQYNTELLNKVGNLAQRTLGIVNKNTNNILPPVIEYNINFDFSNPKQLTEQLLYNAQNANKFFDDQQPWKLKEVELNNFLAIITGRILALLPAIQKLTPSLYETIKNRFDFANKNIERKISYSDQPIIKKLTV